MFSLYRSVSVLTQLHSGGTLGGGSTLAGGGGVVSAFSLYVLTQLHSGGTLGEGVRWWGREYVGGGGGVRWWGGGGLLDVGYVEGVRREDRSKTAQKPLKSCLKNRSKITARNERFLSGFLSKI